MEQIRIIKEMRDADVRRDRTGKFIRPRFMVWEQVPGAFSSNKGDDFRAVLEETIRIADPDAPDVPLPAKGKWPMADAWYGDGWSVAYRVLDAQFWGVPQRRRRIALVADFGGHAAPEILFVRESVCGDITAGGTPGEETAARTGSGTETAGIVCMNPWDCQSARVYCASGVWHSLNANNSGGQSRDAVLVAGFKPHMGEKARGIGYEEEKAPTVDTGKANAVLTMEPMPFDTTQVTSTQNGSRQHYGDKCHPITAKGHAPAIAMRQHRFGEYREGVGTLTAGNGVRHTGETLVITGVDCRNGTETKELSATLQAGGIGYSPNSIHPVRIGGQVRRLTPLECERLQGYPDGWTDIGAWTDSAGKLHKESSDSARYKALGNSIALPPWSWVLKRLCACYERTATMASLFDGIGGFPLIWERLNGPGTCLWESEIEEFPIAVTRRRFYGKEG